MKGSVHIRLVGKEDVGKTAIAVRFLTGRYLSEYAHPPEMVYERFMTVNGRPVPLKITDVSGKRLEARSAGNDLAAGADGLVVVYGIDDAHSHEVAAAVCERARCNRKSSNLPLVLLLGNRADLHHRRCVPRVEPPLTERIDWPADGHLAAECSASCDQGDIRHIFHALIARILETRERAPSFRRPSQNSPASPSNIRATLRRRFSLLTRERTSTM